MKFQLSIPVIIILFVEVRAIWPPSYKINLSNEEEFVIGDEPDNIDPSNIHEAEDEMIKEKKLQYFKLHKDSQKYMRLHQLAIRHNIKNTYQIFPQVKKSQNKYKEINYDFDDDEPLKPGFIHTAEKIKNVRNIDIMTNSEVTMTNIKNTEEKDYDYEILKREYYKNVQNINSNETLRYIETKDEESLKDAVNVIIGKNGTAQNCSVEETKGIGLAAAKCFWSDLTNPQTNKKQRSVIFHRIIIIIQIWVLVYLLIAIPCWCQRGWCCCCFQFKFCKPRQRIDGAKKFLLDNPFGVYQVSRNENFTYKPTNYEKYAQNNLEKALMKL